MFTEEEQKQTRSLLLLLQVSGKHSWEKAKKKLVFYNSFNNNDNLKK